MKKFLSLLALVSLPLAIISALVPKPATVEHAVRMLTIGGFYGAVDASVSVNLIDSGGADSGSIEGVPFNIEDDTVNPTDSSGGRLIGNWSLTSNSLPVNLSVTADDLTLIINDDAGQTTTGIIPYILRFSFSYPIYDTNGNWSYNEIGSFYVCSSSVVSVELKSSDIPTGADSDGSYRFEENPLTPQKLTINQSDLRILIPSYARLYQNYSPGTYNATVTLTMEVIG